MKKIQFIKTRLTFSRPVPGVSGWWKGVVNSGKTGLFNPGHTVAYLGSNLPSNKPGQFTRGGK